MQCIDPIFKPTDILLVKKKVNEGIGIFILIESGKTWKDRSASIYLQQVHSRLTPHLWHFSLRVKGPNQKVA